MKGLRKELIVSAVMASAMLAMQLQGQAASGSATAGTIQMVPANAALSKGLDAKKAKQGDPVTAKLEEDVKPSSGAELPRNTVLLGHVDQVQASEKKSDSSIQVTFDKAQLKNGQQLPIKATVMQIAPSASLAAMQASGGVPATNAPAASSPSPAPGPTGASGNGGGSSPGAAPAASSMQNAMPSDSGAPAMASQQNGVDGVTVQSDLHQSNSGTFMAKGKNVHLMDGTELHMALAVMPQTNQAQ